MEEGIVRLLEKSRRFLAITARQHNIFGKKQVDSGGNAQREAFATIISWMKQYNYPQFKAFLLKNLFNEFTSFDTLLANRVKTTKKKARVEKVISNLSGTDEYKNDLALFIANIIKGSNPVHKYFVAKFLTRPRLSVRKGHKKMLPETKKNMLAKQEFLKLVCDKANLAYVQKSGYIDFKAFNEWKKEYNLELESVLFSSGKIREFDKQQFLAWLEKLPSSARFRVRCRLLTDANAAKNDKWGEMAKWMLEWEAFKTTKQTEVRVVEEKIRQGTASEEEQVALKTLKKEAKTTVGAVDFINLFKEIITGTVDRIKVQPFLDRISLPYNNLVWADDSGSMTQRWSSGGFSAYDMACFIATICLLKNPDDTGRSILGLFSREARIHSVMNLTATRANSLMVAKVSKSTQSIIDPNLHFLDNLQRVRGFMTAMQTGNGTNISGIPDYLARQIQQDPDILEQLQAFPVWTIISDGNWNNMPSPESSINDMLRKCENMLGFKPFIVAIDVANGSSANVDRFSGIENFMFIPPNPAQIEQFLTNFKDMDVMDVYFPLDALHRSNRYELVRQAVI